MKTTDWRRSMVAFINCNSSLFFNIVPFRTMFSNCSVKYFFYLYLKKMLLLLINNEKKSKIMKWPGTTQKFSKFPKFSKNKRG